MGILLLPVVLLLLPATQTIYWVGATDLEITFTVTDAATDQPVPGATIRVHSRGGFYDEADRETFFTMTTDEAGAVTRLCRNSMCFGSKNWYTDTYVVHLPHWTYRVEARGYARNDLIELDLGDNIRRVQRGKPARLVVPTRLEK